MSPFSPCTITGCDDCAERGRRGEIVVIGSMRCGHGREITGESVLEPSTRVYMERETDSSHAPSPESILPLPGLRVSFDGIGHLTDEDRAGARVEHAAAALKKRVSDAAHGEAERWAVAHIGHEACRIVAPHSEDEWIRFACLDCAKELRVYVKFDRETNHVHIDSTEANLAQGQIYLLRSAIADTLRGHI